MLYAAAMRTKTACARASCPAFLSGCHRTLSRRYAARAASASPRALGGSCSASSACRRSSQRSGHRKVSRLQRNAARVTQLPRAKRARVATTCCSHTPALQSRRGVARLLCSEWPFCCKHRLHPGRVISGAARRRWARWPHACVAWPCARRGRTAAASKPYRRKKGGARAKTRAPLRAGAAMQARVDAVRTSVEGMLAEFDTKTMRPLQVLCCKACPLVCPASTPGALAARARAHALRLLRARTAGRGNGAACVAQSADMWRLLRRLLRRSKPSSAAPSAPTRAATTRRSSSGAYLAPRPRRRR